MVRLLTAGATDIGMRRNNEDAYLVSTELGLFALADGMGGAASGEIASSCFIETAQELFEMYRYETANDLGSVVHEVFRISNSRILDHVADHPEDRGMGCTGELLAFRNDQYIIGHVGDSRTYLFRDDTLRQMTKDHSLVQSQIDEGILSAEGARNHPRRNIILRAIGTEPSLQLDVIKGRGRDRDIFLICSDGLTDAISDESIAESLSSGMSMNETARTLIRSALSSGGKDNITVILCKLDYRDQ